MSVNLANIVDYWARLQPQRMALQGEVSVSWFELDAGATVIALGLRGAGVGHGDRVAVFADNCIEYCQLMVATFKLGAILVPLNVRSTAVELRHLLDHSGSRVLVTDPAHAQISRTALATMTAAPRLVALEGRDDPAALARALPRSPGAELGEVAIDAEDVAVICYTSGTTGFPKGAMLTHGNLWSMATSRILVSQMTNQDIGYLPFSLSFAGGIAGVYIPHYVVGAGLVVHGAYDPEVALRTIQEARVTVFSAVPVIWEQMVRHPDFERYDLTSLRSCFSGGAPVPLSLLERLQEVGIPMSQAYGITEASSLGSVLSSADAHRKLGSAGLALLHSRMRIVDETMREKPRGQVGELMIRGPNVMKGYWNAPEATAEALVDGWLRTGDLARMDEEGFVTLVDRAKDLIISGGLNIYPAEIEKVIAAIPDVIEVAVIGVSHDVWGETPVAVIRAGRALAAEELRDTCVEQLADYKVPRHAILVAEPLPRNASGKVLKREIRERYAVLPEAAIRLR